MDGLRALVRHLRSSQGPHDVGRLSGEFGLAEEVVAAAIERARAAAEDQRGWRLREALGRALAGAARRAAAFAVGKPLGYFALTSLVVGPALTLWFTKLAFTPNLAVLLAPALLSLTAFPALHAPVAFVRGDWRLGPASGAAAFVSWLTLPLALAATSAALSSVQSGETRYARGDIALVVLFSAVVSVLSTGAVALAGLVGGYERSRRRASRKDGLPRAELVRLLLAAREELHAAEARQKDPSPAGPSRTRPWLLVAAVLVSIVVQTGLGPMVQAQEAAAARVPETALEAELAQLVGFSGAVAAGLGMALVDAAALLAFGYLAGSLRWALFLAVAYFLGQNVTNVLPVGHVQSSLGRELYAAAGAATVSYFAFLAGIGAGIRKAGDWRRREARLQGRHLDALRKEVIDLEWRLAPQQPTECVMAVDVVGSAALKDGADPLAAEATFRDYQSLVQETARRHGGTVHATAGDGAVLGFPRPQAALAAASAIHAAMQEFNQCSNRLGRDFRLRIGIHLDEVYGELSEMQFSRAIDVACHVEGKAAPGGIAVTDAFAIALPESHFRPLDAETDGHAVYEPVATVAATSG